MKRVYILVGIVLAVLFLDQGIKFWIKTTMIMGEVKPMIQGWIELHFTENPGMALGIELGGKQGKILLTIFRILAVGFITYYLAHLFKKNAPFGLMICIALILAGALGNIIDSAFYGVMFSESLPPYDPTLPAMIRHQGQVAEFMPEGGGYAPFLMGNVVDMFHFTRQITFPGWFPVWSGETKEIFPPVFNVADSAITVGVLVILIFQRRFFPQQKKEPVVDPVVEAEEPMDLPTDPQPVVTTDQK